MVKGTEGFSETCVYDNDATFVQLSIDLYVFILQHPDFKMEKDMEGNIGTGWHTHWDGLCTQRLALWHHEGGW